MKKLSLAFALIFLLTSVFAIVATAEEDYDILFNIFDIPTDEWQIATAGNPGYIGEIPEINNDGTTYHFVTNNLGWPSARYNLLEDLEVFEQYWPYIYLVFDFTVVGAGSIVFFDDSMQLRLNNSFLQATGREPNHVGDMTAGDYAGRISMYDILANRIAVVYGPNNPNNGGDDTDCFVLEPDPWPESEVFLNSVQVWPVLGHMIFREFHLVAPAGLFDGGGTEPPVAGEDCALCETYPCECEDITPPVEPVYCDDCDAYPCECEEAPPVDITTPDDDSDDSDFPWVLVGVIGGVVVLGGAAAAVVMMKKKKS